MTGDELGSSTSSSVLKSHISTMTASPQHHEVQTDTEDLIKETDVVQKRDAQTFTSQANIRSLVHEEEEKLNNKVEEEVKPSAQSLSEPTPEPSSKNPDEMSEDKKETLNVTVPDNENESIENEMLKENNTSETNISEDHLVKHNHDSENEKESQSIKNETEVDDDEKTDSTIKIESKDENVQSVHKSSVNEDESSKVSGDESAEVSGDESAEVSGDESEEQEIVPSSIAETTDIEVSEGTKVARKLSSVALAAGATEVVMEEAESQVILKNGNHLQNHLNEKNSNSKRVISKQESNNSSDKKEIDKVKVSDKKKKIKKKKRSTMDEKAKQSEKTTKSTKSSTKTKISNEVKVGKNNNEDEVIKNDADDERSNRPSRSVSATNTKKSIVDEEGHEIEQNSQSENENNEDQNSNYSNDEDTVIEQNDSESNDIKESENENEEVKELNTKNLKSSGTRSRPKTAKKSGIPKRIVNRNLTTTDDETNDESSSSYGRRKFKMKGKAVSEVPQGDYDTYDEETYVATSSDERTHTMMIEDRGRDELLVSEAPPSVLPSSASTHGRDTGDSGYKESGYSDTFGPDKESDVDGPTDPERQTEDEEKSRIIRKSSSIRRRRRKREERALGKSVSDGEDNGREVNGMEDNDDYDDGNDDGSGRNKRASKEWSGEEDMDEEVTESQNQGEKTKAEGRRSQSRSGALSGGPRKVENIESNLKRRKRSQPPSTEMSITQAMQTTMRKYALERRLFQQLLEMKRSQIRNTKANEHVLVKRLVDSYNKEGQVLGIRGYAGPYSFEGYEKYLYDQLRFLQSAQGTKIPIYRPTDDVDKLTRALRRAELMELPESLDKRKDPHECNHTTHRCHHAAHAYTGVPCAAYLGHKAKRKNLSKYNSNSKLSTSNSPDNRLSLPRIAGTENVSPGSLGSGGGRLSSNEPMGLRNYDPKNPLTVELQHGQARQQITLPTELLDKNKKYHLTFSIKPNA